MVRDYALQELVFIRYIDHVLYNRASALVMQPQVREAVGWLVYECNQYVTICWDRDADPPTLRGGDSKASGLVLLKSDIIRLERLKVTERISHGTVERILNSPEPVVKVSMRSDQRSEKLKERDEDT